MCVATSKFLILVQIDVIVFFNSIILASLKPELIVIMLRPKCRFNEDIGITGAILTKMDGDTRGGSALSVRAVSGKPIKFMGVGEGTYVRLVTINNFTISLFHYLMRSMLFNNCILYNVCIIHTNYITYDLLLLKHIYRPSPYYSFLLH